MRDYSAVVLFIVTIVCAGYSANDFELGISGYSSFEVGEIMEGYSFVTTEPEIRRAWLQTGYVGLQWESGQQFQSSLLTCQVMRSTIIHIYQSKFQSG